MQQLSMLFSLCKWWNQGSEKLPDLFWVSYWLPPVTGSQCLPWGLPVRGTPVALELVETYTWMFLVSHVVNIDITQVLQAPKLTFHSELGKSFPACNQRKCSLSLAFSYLLCLATAWCFFWEACGCFKMLDLITLFNSNCGHSSFLKHLWDQSM